MELHNSGAEVYVPDGSPVNVALSRTTHLCVSAHQDDIEIMAYHGILECFGRSDKGFTGVTVTNGSGSPRDGFYESYTDEETKSSGAKNRRKPLSSASTRPTSSLITPAAQSRILLILTWWRTSRESSRRPSHR